MYTMSIFSLYIGHFYNLISSEYIHAVFTSLFATLQKTNIASNKTKIIPKSQTAYGTSKEISSKRFILNYKYSLY